MADLKKFLDQAGVSTLWSRIAEEVAKVDAKAVKNAEDILAHDGRLTAAEGKIEALEKGTYDDTEVRDLIADNVVSLRIQSAISFKVSKSVSALATISATLAAAI